MVKMSRTRKNGSKWQKRAALVRMVRNGKKRVALVKMA